MVWRWYIFYRNHSHSIIVSLDIRLAWDGRWMISWPKYIQFLSTNKTLTEYPSNATRKKQKKIFFFHKRLSFFINFPSYFLDTYHVQSFSFLQATMTQSARKIDWFRGIGNENRLFSCKIKSLIWAFGRSHSSSSLPPSLSFYFGN